VRRMYKKLPAENPGMKNARGTWSDCGRPAFTHGRSP
jgi:hypothetical protein